ncbi:hypothetical protein MKY95_10065 [Paenibacillus sp. FSL P4-0176]|uniref:hypothetical protein n=1 Tax=Paenibacillus sp. FSL P4-0176 TaxID=2921631 RepID=UPI0030D4C59C
MNLKTQLAATPIVYGDVAKQIRTEASKPTSDLAKRNGNRLIQYFDKRMIRK